jgi:cell wall-associated NlpC family hydrolase
VTVPSILGKNTQGVVGGIPARVIQIQAKFAPRANPATATAFASALDQASTASTSSTSSTSSGTGAVSGEDVVDSAKKYIGVPYVWGGTDPAVGMDCSAFTQRAYKDQGIDIPRSSFAQANVGTKVASISEAKPGDLLIYGGGDHVVMYIGNGQVIHAPSTGNKIRIQNVWSEGLTGIRRVVPDKPVSSRSTMNVSGSGLSTQSLLAGGAGATVADPVNPSVPYADMFNAAGAKHGVPPRLLAAMCKTESNFNPKAGSHAGAQGLMQFMPATARSYNIDPWDPAQAIDGAARYMKNSLNAFPGRTDLAVASYNAGAGAVQKAGNNVPPINETQNYVRLVLQRVGEMA